MAFLRSFASYRMQLFLLLTVLVISTEIAVTHTASFSRHPTGLSIAVLFDLVVVTTGLFYWLIARPRRLANSRVILVALLMLRIALFILPGTAFPSDKIWPALLILVESAVVITLILRIRTIAGTYRQLKTETDSETALRDSLARVVSKRVAGFIVGEGLTLYYVLLGWHLQPDIPDKAHSITTHRQSGQVALTVSLLVIGTIEGIVVHLLLSRWNPTVAIWVTALSVYGMFFFMADIIATIKRPSYVMPDRLTLRLGIRWRAHIDPSIIKEVSLIHEKPPKQSDRVNGAFLTAPNVLLTFQEPICLTGPYGIQKTVRQLSFFVDDRAAFVAFLSQNPAHPVNPVEKKRNQSMNG